MTFLSFDGGTPYAEGSLQGVGGKGSFIRPCTAPGCDNFSFRDRGDKCPRHGGVR